MYRAPITRTLLSAAALSMAAIVGTPAFANHSAAHTAQQAAATKARCDKLSAAAAAKDAACVAYAKAHPDAMQAGDAMMSHDDAMQAKPH